MERDYKADVLLWRPNWTLDSKWYCGKVLYIIRNGEGMQTRARGSTEERAWQSALRLVEHKMKVHRARFRLWP